MISVGKCAPSPLAFPKAPRSQPIGSMHTNVTRPTMPIGMSRSVIGSVSALPALRARDAANALARPLISGFPSFNKVQIAEITIAPAPIYLTLPLHAARERSHWCGEIVRKTGIMRHSPAPADQRTDKHRDSDRETDQVPNPEQQKRQREIVTGNPAFSANPKILRDIGSEDLCLDDQRKS